MVRIIKVRAISEYIESNPKSALALEAWKTLVESCTWEKPLDIVQTFGAKAVDILGKKNAKSTTRSPERVVIDIKGNHIRVIAKYQFYPAKKMAWLYLKWIGTHVEYDELCAKNMQYEIEMFT